MLVNIWPSLVVIASTVIQKGNPSDAITMASVAEARRQPQADNHPPLPSLNRVATADAGRTRPALEQSGAMMRSRTIAADAFNAKVCWRR